jgi:hypothetical protein
MPNVYARTLKRAAEIVGSEEGLASRLEVELAQLGFWLRGAATPPTRVFLAAVDLIALHDGPKPPGR